MKPKRCLFSAIKFDLENKRKCFAFNRIKNLNNVLKSYQRGFQMKYKIIFCLASNRSEIQKNNFEYSNIVSYLCGCKILDCLSQNIVGFRTFLNLTN